MPEVGTRRRVVMPDDLLRYHRQWDRKLEQAFSRFERVEQPLAVVLPEWTLAKALEIAAGRVRMDSILNCYWARSTNGKAVADLPEGRARQAV
jgi:hypothetical protein